MRAEPDTAIRVRYHSIHPFVIICQPPKDKGYDAIDSFEVSPDGKRVVYMAETMVPDNGRCDEVHELFSAPIDRSADAVQIRDSPDVGGFDADTYEIGTQSHNARW